MSTQKTKKKITEYEMRKKKHGKMNQSANKEDILLHLLQEETVNGVL